MSELHPTLWRTCRAIASPTRLQLLWCLFQNEGLCISELAQQVHISEPNASNQLRALNARGLITPQRAKLKVIYHPEPNVQVAHAEELLNALRRCCESKMSHKLIIRQATAFTHHRRILIVRALAENRQTAQELSELLSASSSSVALHLLKLEARGFVRNVTGTYRLRSPANSLGRALMKIALS